MFYSVKQSKNNVCYVIPSLENKISTISDTNGCHEDDLECSSSQQLIQSWGLHEENIKHALILYYRLQSLNKIY